MQLRRPLTAPKKQSKPCLNTGDRKTYTELSKLGTFDERLEYLKLNDFEKGGRGREFHCRNRARWDKARIFVVGRDLGYDLGIPGATINGPVLVHHMNPVTAAQIAADVPELYDPEYLISTSVRTHDVIHYGKPEDLPDKWEPRKPGDNKLW